MTDSLKEDQVSEFEDAFSLFHTDHDGRQFNTQVGQNTFEWNTRATIDNFCSRTNSSDETLEMKGGKMAEQSERYFIPRWGSSEDNIEEALGAFGEYMENDTSWQHRDQTEIPCLRAIGGVGKTQLALDYSHRHRPQFQVILWERACESQKLFPAGLKELPKHLLLQRSSLHQPRSSSATGAAQRRQRRTGLELTSLVLSPCLCLLINRYAISRGISIELPHWITTTAAQLSVPLNVPIPSWLDDPSSIVLLAAAVTLTLLLTPNDRLRHLLPIHSWLATGCCAFASAAAMCSGMGPAATGLYVLPWAAYAGAVLAEALVICVNVYQGRDDVFVTAARMEEGEGEGGVEWETVVQKCTTA